MLVRMWSSWNSHTLLVRTKNGLTTSENSLVVSYKVKHRYTIQSSDSTPRYLSSEMQTVFVENPARECLWKLC